MEKILYHGPENQIMTAKLVDDLNAIIASGKPTEDVLTVALAHIYGMLGQLEYEVKLLKDSDEERKKATARTHDNIQALRDIIAKRRAGN